MTRLRPLVSFACLAALIAPARGDDKAAPAPSPDVPVSFHRQVLPILQRKCQGCHQPAKANGKLNLTTFDALKAGGANGALFEAGKPVESSLIENVTGKPPAMPPNAPPLAADEVATLARWIEQGGKDDTPPQAKDSIDADHPPVYEAPPVTTALAFAPDGQTLAISGYREVLIHRADGSGLARRLVGQAQRIEGLTFSPDGSTLAVGGSGGEARVYRVSDGARVATLPGHKGGIYALAYAPDGSKIATGGFDGTVRVFATGDGKPLAAFIPVSIAPAVVVSTAKD